MKNKTYKSVRKIMVVAMLISGIGGVYQQEIDRPLISPLPDGFIAQVQEVTEKATPHIQVVLAAEPTPSPVSDRVESLYKKIHFYESNSGTAKQGLHVTCRSKGLVNEWGYLPKPGFCFSSREIGVKTVKNWITKRLDYSDSQILCLYNTGKLTDTCPYAQGNLSEAK